MDAVNTLVEVVCLVAVVYLITLLRDLYDRFGF